MTKLLSNAELDALLEMQQRLNHQVRYYFGPSNGPPRDLSSIEMQKARALICDLRFLIAELTDQRDLTGRTMRGVVRNVGASLAYLTVGRSIERSRRLPRA